MKRCLCVVLVLAAALPAAAAGPALRDTQDVVYLGDSGPILIRLHLQLDGRPLPDVWEQLIDKVFKYLDVNGDGVLSKAEAERTPPAQELFNNFAFFGGQGLPLAAGLDTNRDGKVSREELADYYRRSGAAPFQFRYAGSGPQPATYLYAVGAGGEAITPGGNDLNETLFKLLDTNKDGKLTTAELKAGLKVLRKLDANDDEMVSAAELRPNQGMGQTLVATRIPYALEPVGPAGPFVTLTPGKRSPELARQIQARYTRTTPQLKEMLLTRQRLGMDEAAFARLDADGDGILDFEELSCFGKRPPDLEFVVRLGSRGKEQKRVELLPARKGSSLAAKTRRTDEGTVLDLGVTRLVFRPAPERNTRIAIAIEQQYRAQFKAADRDNNGYVDRNEAERNPFFRRIFKAMDRDSDGKLFEKEMLAYLKRMRGLQEAAQKSCVSLTAQDQGRGIFDLIDTSRDGRLSVRELRNMVGLVKQLDRDGDGSIDRTEIPRSYRLDFQKGPPGGGGGYGNVVFVNGRPAPPPVPNPTQGPVWFRKMDRNRDGDLSRREFLGTDAEFRRIDSDGDGLISVEEANRFDQRLRKERGR